MKEVLVSWAFRDHSNHQRGDCHGLYFYHDWYDEDDLQIDEWLTSCEAWFAGVMGGHLGHDVSYGTIEHLWWLKSHAKHILTFIQQPSVENAAEGEVVGLLFILWSFREFVPELQRNYDHRSIELPSLYRDVASNMVWLQSSYLLFRATHNGFLPNCKHCPAW